MKARHSDKLIRVQRVTGLAFLGFLLLHLANTGSAVLGPGSYNEFQRLARLVYQHPLYEVLFLFTPLILHMSCGVLRLWRSRSTASKMSLARRLHRYSGVFLVVAVVGHTIATRGPSLLFGIYPGFEGLAFTIQWMPGYFYPYYSLFAAAALYHAWFALRSMLRTGARARPALAFASNALPVLGWTVIVAALLAFGGRLFPVDDASGSEFAQLILGWAS